LTDLRLLPARLSQRLWVGPAEFLAVIHAAPLADWALTFSRRLRPALPAPSQRGRPSTYQDASILLVALVQVAWQFSYEEVIDYLRSHTGAAQAAGFEGSVISVGQYWQRRRTLGVLPFWLLFIGLVGQLLRLAVIQGSDVILDATTLRVWFHGDPQAAWSYRKPGKGPVWGYKVHTLLCRWSQLPVMFLVTPANRHDSLLAIPLLVLAVTFLGLQITLVRADAAYFTYPILGFIRGVLGASAVIDYNLRRQGKRKLATLFFLRQWRFHQLPRRIIERHFAWAKRYFGLETARWAGLVAAFQHTALVYSVMLGVALVAHRYQRPELAGSRAKVLAVKTLA
jgi:hypothetical protein